MRGGRFLPGFVLLGLACPVRSRAQSRGCHTMRTGTFQIVAPTRDATRIIRSKNQQIEINDSLGLETRSRVRWLNDCTYQLYDKKLVRGPELYRGVKGRVLTVRLVKVLPQGYQAEVSSNFHPDVLTVTMARIK